MNELKQLVLDSGWVARIVLTILFIMSIISWGIIIDKLRLYRKAFKQNEAFLRLFKPNVNLNDLFAQSREFKSSPIARIFRKNANELKKWLDFQVADAGVNNFNHDAIKLSQQKAQVQSLFTINIAEELSSLERHMVFLGTTVSVSPFLGLFGTVWGIMTAFVGMGVKGSAELTAIGPGIAEALITTIAGLGVAIPALIGHNLLISKLRRIQTALENFSNQLIISIERMKNI